MLPLVEHKRLTSCHRFPVLGSSAARVTGVIQFVLQSPRTFLAQIVTGQAINDGQLSFTHTSSRHKHAPCLYDVTTHVV
jgi:hypothetical protein